MADAKKQARADARRAQAKFERRTAQLDDAAKERRESFRHMGSRNGWDGWFTWATEDGEPWMAFMADAFIDRCLDVGGAAVRAFDAVRQEIIMQLPPPQDVPDWLRQVLELGEARRCDADTDSTAERLEP